MKQQRRRITHLRSLDERLAAEAQRLKDLARELPPGSDRSALLRKARQTEAARDVSEWLTVVPK